MNDYSVFVIINNDFSKTLSLLQLFLWSSVMFSDPAVQDAEY